MDANKEVIWCVCLICCEVKVFPRAWYCWTKRQPWPVTNYCMVTNSQAVFTLSVKTFTDETSESVSFMIPLHMFVLEMNRSDAVAYC